MEETRADAALRSLQELEKGARYLRLGELGRGGTSIVYHAWDSRLRRDVAVKVLREDRPSARARFEREAAVVARLSHPHIVTVYDSFENPDGLLQVMELIPGESLAAKIESRRTEPRVLIEALEKVARAVQYAHERGIVHRDLKPANVLVTPEGEPKVVDFGLARTIEGDAQAVTMSPVGTPLYMAPEQVSAGEIGPRADVYALGVMLYEATTGRRPFEGTSVAQIFASIQNDEPARPRSIQPGLPRDLETVALKAMEKSPDRRYATAGEFADDLRRHLNGEPVLARPPGRARKSWRFLKKHPVPAVALLAALAWGLSVATMAIRNASARRRALESRLAEGRRLRTLHARLLEGIARSPAESREIEENQAFARSVYADMIASFTAALGIEGDNLEARRALADLYYRELTEAEREGNDARAVLCERQVRLFDDGAYAARLAPTGAVSLATDPPGAEVLVHRYEEDGDRRLVARAVVMDLASLPTGSYLLVLRLSGYRDTLLPVRIGRGTVRHSRVRLFRDEEIGDGFVYVPAGSFLAGGDPEARASDLRNPDAACDGFFLSEREVTFAEYLEFLNDRSYHPREEALRRSPRDKPVRSELCSVKGPRLVLPQDWVLTRPVTGVSWEDALAYCAWRSKTDPSAEYRLPTSTEWEKAARGADGRTFPWGNHPSTGPDVSPYGVHGLATGVQEWCRDAWPDLSKQIFVKDGRAAGRFGSLPKNVNPHLGFRVVRSPRG